jgi:hypothetical protein
VCPLRGSFAVGAGACAWQLGLPIGAL